jgi:hypothetical protein
MMEAASTSETLVNFHQTARRNIPQDGHLHTRRRENLKSQKFSTSCPSIWWLHQQNWYLMQRSGGQDVCMTSFLCKVTSILSQISVAKLSIFK